MKVVIKDPKRDLPCECAKGGVCGRKPAGEYMQEGWPDSILLCERCEADDHTHDPKPRRQPIYFAHKLRGATPAETEANRKEAAWLVADFVNWAEALGEPIAPVCAWIHLAEVWSEEEGRALGLVIDTALIDLVKLGDGQIWLIGKDMITSQGMQIEINHAAAIGLPIRDYRGLNCPAAVGAV